MSDEHPFVPDRFQSTIPFYLDHRPRYPRALIAEIIRRGGVTEQDRVLDLGCGPGFVALELAAQGMRGVLGLDPDPAMLDAARVEAERAGVAVQFSLGSSYDLSPAMGALKLVTMGRSFHWMDRVATLAALDEIIMPEGAIVFLTDMPEPAQENRWKGIMKDVQYAFSGTFSVNSRPRAAILLNSAFSQLERYAIIDRYPMTIDMIVGRAFTLLESSPKTLGDRMGAFEAELRSRLLDLSPTGEFTEVVEFSALFARRR